MTDTTHPVFSTLTEDQCRAARQEGAVVVLAGAGTGKTSTLVAGVCDRIERRHMPPHRLLAVTFTNKAAREMRERIAHAVGHDRTPNWVGTFHAHACRMLRRDPGIASLRPGFDILTTDDSMRILRRLMKAEIRADGAASVDDATADLLRKRARRLIHHIGGFKDRLVLPEEAWAHRPARPAAEMTEGDWILCEAIHLYPIYQEALRRANAADFGDLLLYPTRAMMSDETYRREWASRFDAVMVDEFQDVNLAQYRWLRLLSQDHGEFFGVGDDAQSIYGWRGADIGYIRNFLAAFPGGRMIALERNFRSTGVILEAANAIIALDPDRLPKTLYTEAGPGLPIEIIACKDGSNEALRLAREIGRRAAEGVAWHDMAVLYRFNFLSRVIEEQLLAQRIPYVLVGDTGFWQRGAVRDGLAYLRLMESAESGQSDEAFRRVVNLPKRGIGAKTLARIEQAAEEQGVSLFVAAEQMQGEGSAMTRLHAFLATIRAVALGEDLTLGERIEMLLQRVGYSDMLRQLGDEGLDPLQNLHELILIAGNFATSEALFDHAALGAGAPGDGLDGRVRLMTIHGAKGLEFRHVFLVGWENSLFPQFSEGKDANEERRLAYVALTRARERVTISWAIKRGNRWNEASSFIDEIPTPCRNEGSLRQAGGIGEQRS